MVTRVLPVPLAGTPGSPTRTCKAPSGVFCLHRYANQALPRQTGNFSSVSEAIVITVTLLLAGSRSSNRTAAASTPTSAARVEVGPFPHFSAGIVASTRQNILAYPAAALNRHTHRTYVSCSFHTDTCVWVASLQGAADPAGLQPSPVAAVPSRQVAEHVRPDAAAQTIPQYTQQNKSVKIEEPQVARVPAPPSAPEPQGPYTGKCLLIPVLNVLSILAAHHELGWLAVLAIHGINQVHACIVCAASPQVFTCPSTMNP